MTWSGYKIKTVPGPSWNLTERKIEFLPAFFPKPRKLLNISGALGRPRGMARGGRWEGASGWGTRVHPWRIHVDVWQNQYNIVK